jgi:hypothetical protein
MVGIDQQLDGNISDGLYAANNPSTGNPIATMADVGEGIPAFGDERQFLQITDFNTGSLPVGWSGSVSGTGSTVVYNQVSEPGVSPGMALATVTTTTNARVSLVTGTGYQYMKTFTDSIESIYFTQARWNGVPSPTNCVQILGWINQNAFTPLSAMGNALAIMYDPNNASGFNPGLITNLFLIARANYNGPIANTIVDLGVTYDNVNWRAFKIVYDNVLNEVRVYRDNVLLTTLLDMSNVPGGVTRGLIPAAASAGLQAGFYLGNAAVAPATGSAIRIAKVTVFKRYS